jgi:predicted nucleic acid-binding Zn ribbon protein
MQSASALLASLLPVLLDRAPLTPDKVAFAWRTVVGTAMARSTRVELLASGTLLVRTDDVNWRREVERAAAVVLPRMRALLGADVVRRITLAD